MPPAPRVIEPEVVRAPAAVPCPFCDELISPNAKKCKHCGELLDPRLRAADEARRANESAMHAASAPAATPPTMIVAPQQNVVVNVHQMAVKRWSRLLAMFLSFLIPGLGQLYKGQPFNGILWFVLTAIGYFPFIIPGLILHLCCIVGAGMGDPYR